MEQGAGESANGDKMALIEVTAPDWDKARYINPAALCLRQTNDNFK